MRNFGFMLSKLTYMPQRLFCDKYFMGYGFFWLFELLFVFSEDYKSVEKSEAGDSESSGDEGFHNTGSNEGLANEGQSEDSEPDQGGEESDSSEDEVAPRNTVGDVPLEWYRDGKTYGV
ncbi:hypothetical protein OIU84_004927 [Salix udensis]|uniref:Uncharacterized protein n=1 Tax=Salix udensis TaxID=889485 RepID=A0AAD6P4G3_9ROSI|nr:hypothetical protein OIU84_004927 [Salix udensis]